MLVYPTLPVLKATADIRKAHIATVYLQFRGPRQVKSSRLAFTHAIRCLKTSPISVKKYISPWGNWQLETHQIVSIRDAISLCKSLYVLFGDYVWTGMKCGAGWLEGGAQQRELQPATGVATNSWMHPIHTFLSQTIVATENEHIHRSSS